VQQIDHAAESTRLLLHFLVVADRPPRQGDCPRQQADDSDDDEQLEESKTGARGSSG
jgi:hypothetical protein